MLGRLGGVSWLLVRKLRRQVAGVHPSVCSVHVCVRLQVLETHLDPVYRLMGSSLSYMWATRGEIFYVIQDVSHQSAFVFDFPSHHRVVSAPYRLQVLSSPV